MLSGVAVFGTGAVLGLTANSSFEDLKKTDPQTRADAQGIHRDFDEIETRATIANILMPIGGAAMAIGAVFLIVDLSDGDSTEQTTSRVGLEPTSGGVMLTVRGALGTF